MINDKNSLNKIIGTRELRANLSSFLDSVINNGTEITTGHIKKRNSETASILPTQILIAMLKDAYAFNLIIEFDKETQQYSAGIDELKIYTVSDTIENVKSDIVDLVAYFGSIRTPITETSGQHNGTSGHLVGQQKLLLSFN
jgi:hypothetical protein